MPLTDDAIREIIKRGEDIFTEFKEILSQQVIEGLSTDLCGFANSEGGRIVIGVDDKGEIVGCNLDDRVGNRISQEASKCTPQVQMNIENYLIDGKNLLLINIPRSNHIHRDKLHRFPIRIGRIVSYLDTTGFIKLAIERFGLVYGKPIGEVNLSLANERQKRSSATEDEIKFYLENLTSSQNEVRAEASKDLASLFFQKSFLFDTRIFELIGKLLDDKDDSVRYNTLEVLRASFHSETNELTERITNKYLDKVAELALKDANIQVRKSAIVVLGLMNKEKSVEVIFMIIGETDNSTYNQLNIPNDVAYIKSFIGGELFRKKAYQMLMSNFSENVNNRIKEILGRIRYG